MRFEDAPVGAKFTRNNKVFKKISERFARDYEGRIYAFCSFDSIKSWHHD